ncbi:MAG: FAD-binding oxidoreductase [Candidatus Kapaibacterium sp.]
MTQLTDKETFASYLIDASNTRGDAAGVFVPGTIDEVREAVRSCHEERRPLHIAGNGTGLVGGRVPAGGAVISLERLREHSIDTGARRGSVQSGLSMREWQESVSRAGLLYPPDPTEWSAAMGGTFATNASGARTFRYGPTRRYVEGLHVILADGQSLTLQRGECVARDGVLHLRTDEGTAYHVPVPRYTMPATRKHAAGYFAAPDMDAVDLFIGSEGTLGLIVEAQVRLVPEPEKVVGMIVFFADSEDVLDAVERLRGTASDAADATRLQPRLVEFFDVHALAMIRPRYPQIPTRARAALWIESEVDEADEDAVFAAWNGFLESVTDMSQETWFASDARRHAELRAFRHALPSAVYERVSDAGSTKIGTDIAVPPSMFRSFFSFYHELFREHGVDYVLFGHIGDCHLHANIFANDAHTHRRMTAVYDLCIEEGLRLGGTVSAEHGIGKLKKRYLHALYGDDGIAQMRAVKRTLDPQGILSPGNMFDA